MTTETTTKTCPACQRDLPEHCFKKNPASKSGLYTYCKDCEKQRRRTEKHEVEEAPVNPSPIAFRGVETTMPAGLFAGLKIPKTVHQPCVGVWKWRTPKDWCVIAIHYSADPKKRPGTPEGDAWLAAEKQKMSPRDWQREMEGDHTISEGQPFFTTFSRQIHVRKCVYDPDLPILRGWDFGRGHPACIWAQKAKTNQLRVLYSILETQKDIFHFAPMVLAETNARFPGAIVHDFGDPAGAQETDKGATTVILLDEFGIKINYLWSANETGLKMMERALMVREDGEPGLLIDPINVTLIDGFAGGYKLDTGASGKDTEGRLKNSPKKDGTYDHLMDALRYIFVNIFQIISHGRDKALEAVSLWMTNAERKKKELEEGSGAVEEFFE